MSNSINDAERDLDVPDTVTEGASKRADIFDLDGVQFTGPWTGGWDVQLEGTIDGVTWNAVGGSATADTLLEVSGTPLMAVTWSYLRVSTLVVGTGSPPSVSLAGRKPSVG